MKFSHAQQIKFMLVIYLFIFFHFFQMDMMDALGQILQKNLHISTEKLGIVDSVFFYADFLMIYIAGVSLDWFEPKYLMIFSVAINLIGLLIFNHFHTFDTLICWRILSGIGMSYAFVSAIKIISVAIDDDKFGVAFSKTGFSMMPAGVLAHKPTLWFIQKWGLAEFFHMYLIAGVGLILLMYFFLTTDIKEKSVKIFNKLKIFSVYNISAALYSAFANLPLFILGASFGMSYLMRNYAMTTTHAAYIISLLFIGDMFGSLMWGFLFDKLTIIRNKLIIIGWCVYLVTTTAMVLIRFHPSPVFLGVLFAVLGLATSSQTLAYVGTMKKNSSVHIGKIVSLISLLSVGMGAVFESIFTRFFDSDFISHGLIWLCISFLLALFAIIMLGQSRQEIYG